MMNSVHPEQQQSAPETSSADPSYQTNHSYQYSAESLMDVVHRRQEALDRARAMHIRHAEAAWYRRHSDPIGPYALAFLYEQPSSKGTYSELKAATRLWTAEEKGGSRRAWTPGADLSKLLQAIHGRLGEFLASGENYDVRVELADRQDEGMRPEARFIGLAVSSLDSASASWEETQRTVDGVGQIFGTALVALIDTTFIVIERGVAFGIHDTVIRASETLIAAGHEGLLYPCVPVTAQTLFADPANGLVLQWMWGLNETVWRLDNARIVASGGA